jgi:hypothetical protein
MVWWNREKAREGRELRLRKIEPEKRSFSPGHWESSRELPYLRAKGLRHPWPTSYDTSCVEG